ncbi:MAG: hypothetical protein ABW065_01745 [Solirubrobacterales bacterium]
MSNAKKIALSLAATALMLGLAACGSSSDDTDAVSGTLEPLSGAPAEYQGVAGEATLERTDSTSIQLTANGLKPKTTYVAHLHTQGCDQADPGGPHFQFDPQGGDEPPNEIHLSLTTKASGSGSAEVTSDREVPVGEAGSVVLHEGGSEDHMTSAPGGEAEAIFVHEGHHHGEADGSGAEHGDHGGPVAIACAELEGSAGEAPIPTIVVRDEEPVGGIKKLEYDAGEVIRFKVQSDKAEEIHLHGYDVMKDVPAGGAVTFEVPAEIEGIFEAELEGAGVQIAEIQVNP